MCTAGLADIRSCHKRVDMAIYRYVYKQSILILEENVAWTPENTGSPSLWETSYKGMYGES